MVPLQPLQDLIEDRHKAGAHASLRQVWEQNGALANPCCRQVGQTSVEASLRHRGLLHAGAMDVDASSSVVSPNAAEAAAISENLLDEHVERSACGPGSPSDAAMTDLYDHECTARAPHNPNTFALSLVICVGSCILLARPCCRASCRPQGLAISYAPQHYRIIKK
jgi:hypothetical protein